MCGCHDVFLISEGGDGDGLFDAGETWVVRSRFFQRAAGYRDASAVYGGSGGGLYDPWVNLQFSHDAVLDVTTVSLVFALTPAGAAALTGEPLQAMDLNAGNHVSVQEAIQDVIDGANGLNGPLFGPVRTLTERWEGESSTEDLDPTRWDVTALIGTAYTAEEDSLYVWTDIGFNASVGDFNGDGQITELDGGAFDQFLSSADGSPADGDGAANGVVAIIDFGYNFSVFDLDGDGQVDHADRTLLGGGCLADRDDDGDADVFDLLDYLTAWFAGDARADVDGEPGVSVFDLLIYLDAWFGGC
jgi:hypothetical protein